MNTKVLFLLGVVTVVLADRPSNSYGPPPQVPRYASSEESEPPKYVYNWNVQDGYSGNDFTHQENREDDNTQGSYTVQLPDGRLQTVTYYVNGDSGYVAEVKYEGEAQYPESEESREYAPPRPRYSAPQSEESVEAPVYAPPRRSYGFPQ
ncbi:pro-resilin-like [Homarus americanus]|uniref:Pro-resilin-like 176 n=1 Tax=Homarus americanus TaxID=6706 RepID=A0A8J5NCN4_HOMAM|nr:pro-resilin-like [Homarus americanus]XP_042227191.1 pro-resilin-like [Homarus americanus]KAG7166324.1 Pro-resilin-like 9 [Homarus americanus]KAG7177920.1 Pro-resilin-like 176 [Homarus americanus]